jgi:hypothetical protein
VLPQPPARIRQEVRHLRFGDFEPLGELAIGDRRRRVAPGDVVGLEDRVVRPLPRFDELASEPLDRQLEERADPLETKELVHVRRRVRHAQLVFGGEIVD